MFLVLPTTTEVTGNLLNSMTEQVKTDDGMPENGPWNMSWKELAKAGGNYIEEATTTVKEAVKKATGPWDWDWKTLSSFNTKQAPKEAPIKPIGQEPESYLDQVYSKLLNAETRTQHTDAKGNLIKSGKGALGISQVMPKTGGNPGYGVTPIQDNTEQEYRRFGRDYLKAMVKEFDGDYEKAVAAYNAGVGSVKKAITKAEGDKGDWKDYLPKRSETIPYLKKVLGKEDNAKARPV